MQYYVILDRTLTTFDCICGPWRKLVIILAKHDDKIIHIYDVSNICFTWFYMDSIGKMFVSLVNSTGALVATPVIFICGTKTYKYDDVIKWEINLRYWPFVRGIHRSPVNCPHTGQWRGALMFSLTCAWINGWVDNRKAGDLRRNRAHYDVIVMNMSRLILRLLIVWLIERKENTTSMRYAEVTLNQTAKAFRLTILWWHLYV